jgi:hypothetical protein
MPIIVMIQKTGRPLFLTRGLCALLAVLATAWIGAAPASAQGPAVVRGEVTDDSGGVMPGVTVAAFSADGRALASAITDSLGQFTLARLPAGPVKIVFELDGFEPSMVTVVAQPGADVRVVERMKLARMTEQVVVVGTVPPDPPPLPRYEPPPIPMMEPVPPEQLETVCRPAKPGPVNESVGAIQAHRYEHGRSLYSKGDQLVINAGTRSGLRPGRNLIAVRYFRRANNVHPAEWGEHTSGLVQILTATEDSSTAVVVHACNELMQGDLLWAFVPQPVQPVQPAGAPVYGEAGRLLFADEGQAFGAPRRLMVMDRGSEQGMRAGQRVTLFRRKGDAALPLVIGDAVVISVRNDSATIRVVTATDAIMFGDFAAPQR